jgi:hypothetical protein
MCPLPGLPALPAGRRNGNANFRAADQLVPALIQVTDELIAETTNLGTIKKFLVTKKT